MPSNRCKEHLLYIVMLVVVRDASHLKPEVTVGTETLKVLKEKQRKTTDNASRYIIVHVV